MNSDYLSWGRFFRYNQEVKSINWTSEDMSFLSHMDKSFLPFGYGRSYGDSCLNENGCLVDTTAINRVIAFDRESGVIRCEAGISLAEILEVVIPAGWFLPVTPGTKFVTLGGAVANDVHGKNHHASGTLGCFVNSFELLRSNGERLICSRDENSDIFNATIGGLGLTGLILWVEIRLKKASAMIDMESIKFANLDEFFEICKEDEKFEYTVAWVDCMAKGQDLGRGIYMRGNHSVDTSEYRGKISTHPKISVPITMPNFLLNELSIKSFNFLYYNKQISKTVKSRTDYNPFFYPLDMVDRWNLIYGRRGFFQYQFVIPEEKIPVIKEIFDLISSSGMASFLAVLKKFGDVPSPGMLSFPRPGTTLALDFVNMGDQTKELFKKLDQFVSDCDGRLYPAKDSFMSSESFKKFYPRWEEFSKFIDPKISSSFWRRVTSDE